MKNRFEGPSQPHPERIRISVSNLVDRIRVTETGETFRVVMRNKKAWAERGELKFQALGGAAKMTLEGKDQLTKAYGAEFGASGRPAEEADDARFFVTMQEGLHDPQLAEILNTFSVQDSVVFETDVMREAHEDLVADGVISEEEFARITPTYEGPVSPIPWKETTSERESGTPSRRIFHLFELEMPQSIFDKLRAADSLRVLTPEDVADIRSSTQKGVPAAPLQSGGVVVENIFPDYEPES